MKINSSEIKSGVCVCKFEPNGMNGIEGFTQGDKYNFKLMMHTEFITDRNITKLAAK